MERRKFTRDFKLEAVRLIKDQGVSYGQASQDPGVHASQLRDWAKKRAFVASFPLPKCQMGSLPQANPRVTRRRFVAL